jgi:hypothetical protein
MGLSIRQWVYATFDWPNRRTYKSRFNFLLIQKKKERNTMGWIWTFPWIGYEGLYILNSWEWVGRETPFFGGGNETGVSGWFWLLREIRRVACQPGWCIQGKENVVVNNSLVCLLCFLIQTVMDVKKTTKSTITVSWFLLGYILFFFGDEGGKGETKLTLM